MLVDERMTVGQVCRLLADKNHVPMDPRWTLVEHIPELFMGMNFLFLITFYHGFLLFFPAALKIQTHKVMLIDWIIKSSIEKNLFPTFSIKDEIFFFFSFFPLPKYHLCSFPPSPKFQLYFDPSSPSIIDNLCLKL